LPEVVGVVEIIAGRLVVMEEEALVGKVETITREHLMVGLAEHKLVAGLVVVGIIVDPVELGQRPQHLDRKMEAHMQQREAEDITVVGVEVQTIVETTLVVVVDRDILIQTTAIIMLTVVVLSLGLTELLPKEPTLIMSVGMETHLVVRVSRDW
jgi:hypothetical protein